MSVLVLLAAFVLSLPWATVAVTPAYCGAPPVDVLRASAPAGMDLRFLIVTTRHGDRTPVGLYPGGASSNDVTWHCNLTHLSAIDTGDETQVEPGRLFRKRYLDGRQVLPGDCMFGQLTSKGRAQHKALGESLRQVYVDKYGFLSSQFSDREIWARSTDVPRTIASAQSLLFGMYPPSGTTAQVPVFDLHTIDGWTDNMTPNTRLCPHLQQIYHEIMQSPAWTAHLHEIAPLDAKIRSIFNLPANTSVDIIDAFDETFARICHDKRLPEGISPLEQTIALNAEFEMAYFYNRSQAAIALNIGSFVGEQVARLDQVVNGQANRDLKFTLYSGHDTTLWPLSFAYGFGSIDYWPPYASHLEIELWQSRAAPRPYYVRFFFNGRPVPALGCSSPGPCLWTTFRSAVDSIIPRNFPQQCAAPVTAAGGDLSRFFRLR